MERRVKRLSLKKVAKTVGVWLPTVFLAFVFVTQGVAKFSATGGWADAFRLWGYPAWFRVIIGVMEVLAAALLLIPTTAPGGAILIVILMIGGIGTHVAAGDRQVFQAELGQIVIATIVLVLRRAELRRVTEWQALRRH